MDMVPHCKYPTIIKGQRGIIIPCQSYYYPYNCIVTIAPTSLDIHDAIVVGTTLHLTSDLEQPVSLVTVDKTISDSNLVPIIW